MSPTDLAHLEETGEVGVLLEIAKGAHGAEGSPIRSEVEAWLRSKRAIADAESCSKRDTREEKTLELARDANRIASRAERWAMIAAIAAVIALIISITGSTN